MDLLKVLVVLFVVLFTSCSSENEYQDGGNNDQKLNFLGVDLVKVNNTLSFDNKEKMIAFSDGISSVSMPISMMKSKSIFTNLTYISELKKMNFRSLYDVYVEAMSEAESYYERAGGYEEFKAKYSSLYFPEEGDDYSAYLPISDKNLAKIADENGNVIIDGKIISLKDITTYEQLKDLGLTPLSDNKLRATSGVNGISEERVGENKVWVNCKNDKDHNIPIVQVDVCFRKKGFLGVWYNHNSGTSAKLGKGGGLKLYQGSMIECFGFSSHDYIYSRISYNGIDVIPVEQDVIIIHNGTGKTLTLHVSYPVQML